MRVSITVDGADVASQKLEEVAARLSAPVQPLLETLAAEMQTWFQSHIQTETGPDGDWPQLHPATIIIREHYGHGAGPRLIRGGDLLHSIQALGFGPDWADVGTNLSYARTVNDGGTATSPHGGEHEVQAFPFLYFSKQEVDDAFFLIKEYFFGASA